MNNMLLRFHSLLVVTFLLLFFHLPAWAQEMEFYPVQAVPNGKVLVLEDGRVIRLAAIQTPNIARDVEEQSAPLAEASRANLERWASERKLRIEPLKKGVVDRHGRIVALVYDEAGELAQAEQLKAGMAWVYTFPDTAHLAKELLAYEAQAEQHRRGVWVEPAYAVLDEGDAPAHLGEFRLVTGDVEAVADLRKYYYINFGADWKTDFTLMVEPKDGKRFDPDWIRELKGKRVRARGWLFNRNGAMMELSHPEQLEILDDAQ